MVAHTGTHLFQNCTGAYSCGPCAGICINIDKSSNAVADANLTPVVENYLLSAEEWDGGARVMQLSQLNDTIMEVTFMHPDLTSNDTLYIPDDMSIGVSAAQEFNKSSIVVKRGKYPLTYSYSSNGTTIVNITCTSLP